MSFWDDLSTGWHAVNNVWNATVGGALSYAENAPVLGGVLKFGETATNDLFAPIDTAFSYGVNRPISTALQVGQNWDTLGHAMTDPNDWRNAWNRSATISPGQAAVIDWNNNSGNTQPGIGTFDMDPASVTARNQYFSQGVGMMASGALDLMTDLIGPAPLKLAKFAAVRRVTFASNAERDAALAAAGGAEGGGFRVNRLGQDIKKLAQSTDNMTEAQIANHPLFYKADNGGAFAYFLGRLNREIDDPAERLQAKLDVIGSAMGNQDAIERLAAKRLDLQNELNAMDGPPQLAVNGSSIAARDGGAGVIQTLNSRGLLSDSGDFMRTNIENQLQRYSNMLDGQGGLGSIDRVKGTWKEAVGSQIRQSEVLGGLGSRPVRVVTGNFIQRVPGVIDTKNPVNGYYQLQTYLRNAYWVQAGERDDLLRKYSSAVTPQDRAAVLDEAEDTVVARTALKYQIPQKQARQILQAGKLRGSAMRTEINSKLFSTADDAGVVKVIDPETGAEHVYDRPVLQSQVENAVALPNPRQLDADFRRLKKSGNIDVLGEDGLPVDDGSSTMGSLANAVLTTYTRAWKDAALFRGAYPFRIQADDQARLMAYMGPLAYLSSWGRTGRAIRTAMTQPNGDRMKLMDLLKGNTDEVVNQYLKGVGIEDENIQAVRNAVMARGGTIADLLDEASNGVLNRYRGNGQWAPMQYNQTGWVPAYKRAILQVQMSPTGRAVARGLQGDDLREFVMNDEAARREWRDLRKAQNNDFDGWLGKVERHVNNLLPDEYLRQRVSGTALPTWDQHLPIFSPGAAADATPEDNALGQSFRVKAGGEGGPAESAWAGGPTLLHGTSNRFPGDVANPDPATAAGPANHFGNGFYTTPDADYAKNYATARKGDSPTVYNVKYNGDSKPRVLKLDSTRTPELRDYVGKFLDQHDDPELRGLLAQGASDEEVLYNLVSYLEDGNFSKEVTKSILGDVNTIFRSKGDVLVGSNGHHVFLDPSKVSLRAVEDATAGQHKYTVSLRDQRVMGTDGSTTWGTAPRDIQSLGRKFGMTNEQQIPIGVLALRRAGVANFQRLTKELKEDPAKFRLTALNHFGDDVVDWSKIQDPIQLLDAYGKMVAKNRGFHSIYDEAGGRYHALQNHAVMDELPDPEALAKQPLSDGEINRAFPNGNGAPVVHGESFSPYDKTSAGAVVGQTYNKLRQGWYRFAAESPENVMSRFPLYVHIYKNEVKRISASLADENGRITDQMLYSAKQSADRLARRQVGNVLFDMSNTTNLAHTLRFVSPFFGAWEDTMRKWWQITYDKPWVPAYAADAWHAPNNVGLVHDENGNVIKANGSVVDSETGKVLDPTKDAALIGNQRLITIPSKYLPDSLAHFVGINKDEDHKGDPNYRDAGGFTLNAKSLDIILGNQWWNPGTGPLAQVPANEFVKHIWTEGENNRAVVNFVLGGQGVDPDGPVEQQIPGWWRQVWNVFGTTHDYSNAYKNIAAYEQSQFDQGKRDAAPSPDEIMWKTRMMFLIRAGTTFGAPVSIKPNAEGQFYTDMYHKYRQMYGPNSPNPDVDGDMKFYQDFPGWFDMSATINANETGINATLAAKSESDKYKDLILKNPDLGWMFVGPANSYGETDRTKFSQAADSHLRSDDFRGNKSPWDAIKDAETQKGWLEYQTGQTAFNLAMESAGVTSLQQRGAEDLQQAHEAWIGDMMARHPDWAVDYLNTNDGAAFNLLTAAAGAMQSHPELAKRADMQALSQYLAARQGIMAELAQRPEHTLEAQANQDLQEQWLDLNQQLVQGNIGFEQMWNRVLQHDKLQQAVY